MRALWASLTLWRPKTRGLAPVGCQVGGGGDHSKGRVRKNEQRVLGNVVAPSTLTRLLPIPTERPNGYYPRHPSAATRRSRWCEPLPFRTSVAYSSFCRVSRLWHPTRQRLPSVHRDLRYARPTPSQPIACKSSLVVFASDALNGAAAHRRRRRRTGAALAASPVGSPLTCVSPPLFALLHFCRPQHGHKQRAEPAPPRPLPRLPRTVSHIAVPVIALGCTTALSARSCPLPYRRRRVRGTPTGRASLIFFGLRC